MDDVKVRLILCDVDGTLLPNGDKEISRDLFDTFNRAISSDIQVCVASGRCYTDLKNLFSPIADNITFICNDGALVVERDTILFSSPLNKSQITCMSRTYKKDNEAFVLYAKNHIYYISEKKQFNFGKKVTTEDLISIPDDIYKVAFYNLSQRAKIKLNNLGVMSGFLNKVYEDAYWTEYIKAQTDKGTAAEFIQKKYNISSSETAAFGDNLNDISMLRKSQYSYAPKNANPEIIKMCKFTTNNVNKEILNIIQKGENYE